MNPIQNVGGNQPLQKIANSPVQKQASADAAARPSPKDRVEISGMSHLLSALRSNDVRADKVAAVKAQIEAGTYEDDEKLDSAVDRLLDDLSK